MLSLQFVCKIFILILFAGCKTTKNSSDVTMVVDDTKPLCPAPQFPDLDAAGSPKCGVMKVHKSVDVESSKVEPSHAPSLFDAIHKGETFGSFFERTKNYINDRHTFLDFVPDDALPNTCLAEMSDRLDATFTKLNSWWNNLGFFRSEAMCLPFLQEYALRGSDINEILYMDIMRVGMQHEKIQEVDFAMNSNDSSDWKCGQFQYIFPSSLKAVRCAGFKNTKVWLPDVNYSLHGWIAGKCGGNHLYVNLLSFIWKNMKSKSEEWSPHISYFVYLGYRMAKQAEWSVDAHVNEYPISDRPSFEKAKLCPIPSRLNRAKIPFETKVDQQPIKSTKFVSEILKTLGK
jgi:hypothetical protein